MSQNINSVTTQQEQTKTQKILRYSLLISTSLILGGLLTLSGLFIASQLNPSLKEVRLQSPIQSIFAFPEPDTSFKAPLKVKNATEINLTAKPAVNTANDPK